MGEEKRHVWEKAGGPMVEFYLPENGLYKEGHVIPYSINGFQGTVKVGAKNRAPKDVVEMLKQCKSSSNVPNLDASDPTKHGAPRKQEDFFTMPTVKHHQQDFKVEILSEDK